MSKIGPYTVIEHIGHGAMGSVEKARSPNGDIVAVKVLYQQFALEATYVKRFKREAQLAKKLSHPNVVKILDVGEDLETHRPFIVMEYIEGQSLSEILLDAEMSVDSGRVQLFTPIETIRIMRQLAGVLQAADDLGLVHRDIKPQNVILDWSGNAKLLDFGFAKDVDAMVSVLSVTGQPIGTPPYMSPEQHEGTKEIDIRSDLYSLGCTAYQMLTGMPPFAGPTGAAFARQHCDEVPVPVIKRNHSCPLNLSQVIDRLLAKSQVDRHQTPAELIEDLNRVERGEVPLKLYKAKKSKTYTPKYTYIVALLVAVVCMGLFYGHIKYRSLNAQTVIRDAIASSRQLAIKHDYDAAKAKLDAVIDNYSVDNPALVAPVIAVRKKLLKEYAAWNAESESRQQQDKVKQAVKQEEDQARQREAAEQNRQRELANLMRNAERWSQDETRVKNAAGLVEKAYELCNTDAERLKVAAVAAKVNQALAKRRPWAVLADFTIDDSVKASITGAAIAVKFEQVMGRDFRLVTRRQVSKALEELRFQSSDLVDQRKAERFGKYVGAEYLITGNVVQLGREITIAVQCFDIETGEICRTAEVSAVDVDDFNHMIREAAEILNMPAEKKRSYLDVKYKYQDAVQAGVKSFNAADYINAAKNFKAALAIKPSKEIKELLDRAEQNIVGQRLSEDSRERYNAAMKKALECLNNKNWNEAERYCQTALSIRGFEKDATAMSGLKNAQAGILEENRKIAGAACDEIIKSALAVYQGLKSQGAGAADGFAKCAAQKSKIEQLRKSDYWKYLTQARRDTVDTIYIYFNNLERGYISNSAERQFEQVYENILTEFRTIQISGSSQAQNQYGALLKKLQIFMASGQYDHLNANDQQSLVELKNLITEYQSKQNYDNTYIRGTTFSYSRPVSTSYRYRGKNRSTNRNYNHTSNGNVIITVNGQAPSVGRSTSVSTNQYDRIIKPNRVPAETRYRP